MAEFRLDCIASFARQLGFTPADVRLQQLAAAEELLISIDAVKAYPLAYVVFRITGFHPKAVDAELLTGIALQHDLGLLVERTSDTLATRAADLPEPVLTIEDLTEKFNVTSKTIQRWRRRGLAARRFVFGDGKRRVGFRLAVVERFIALHGAAVSETANVSRLEKQELSGIVTGARRLARQGGCSIEQICVRLARRFGRSPLTILHTLKKFDAEHTDVAVLPDARAGMTPGERAKLLRAYGRSGSLAIAARRLGRPRSEAYRVVLDDRARRLTARKARFIDDPLYHDTAAADLIAALVCQDELPSPGCPEDRRVPADLPSHLRDLYRTPLLTVGRERALFLQFNYHKFLFAQARRRFDPAVARGRDLAKLEQHLADATRVKNDIVAANLRLVVSVAKRHVRPGLPLPELMSEGNITLMRAVEGFDVQRGNRFSTYATLALMKGFARSVPAMRSAAVIGGAEKLAALPDRSGCGLARFADREHVRYLLSTLTERERHVLALQFGLDDNRSEVGLTVGLSRQRLREIEASALAKLRISSAAHR